MWSWVSKNIKYRHKYILLTPAEDTDFPCTDRPRPVNNMFNCFSFLGTAGREVIFQSFLSIPQVFLALWTSSLRTFLIFFLIVFIQITNF